MARVAIFNLLMYIYVLFRLYFKSKNICKNINNIGLEYPFRPVTFTFNSIFFLGAGLFVHLRPPHHVRARAVGEVGRPAVHPRQRAPGNPQPVCPGLAFWPWTWSWWYKDKVGDLDLDPDIDHDVDHDVDRDVDLDVDFYLEPDVYLDLDPDVDPDLNPDIQCCGSVSFSYGSGSSDPFREIIDLDPENMPIFFLFFFL